MLLLLNQIVIVILETMVVVNLALKSRRQMMEIPEKGIGGACAASISKDLLNCSCVEPIHFRQPLLRLSSAA